MQAANAFGDLTAHLQDIWDKTGAHNDPAPWNLNDASNKASEFVLSWDDVRDILKSGLCPRVCDKLKTANEMLHSDNVKGMTGDYLAVMGGFSRLVQAAVPIGRRSDRNKEAEKNYAIMGRKNVDVLVDVLLDAYVTAPGNLKAARWKALDELLGKKYDGKNNAFKDDEKVAIAKKLQGELRGFLDTFSKNKDTVWVVFLKAFDMMSGDQDGYGFLGKGHAKSLKAEDFDRWVIMSCDGQNKKPAPGTPSIPDRLVWGFVKHAKARALAMQHNWDHPRKPLSDEDIYS